MSGVSPQPAQERELATVAAAESSIPFVQAVRFWLRLGFISFGGPAGQIAIMHQELVGQRRWISEQRFLHALNYCMLLPGPEAQQLATYIGWLMHRTLGGIVAGTLFVLPSLLILIALSWLYVSFGELPWVAALFYGVKAAVTAIILQAAHRLGNRTLHSPLLWAIAGSAFVAIAVFELPFPAIVAAAALIGHLADRVTPGQFAAGNLPSHSAGSSGAALIDDDTPPPSHARFRWQRFVRSMVIGLLLWGASIGLLTLNFGWQHTLTQMGWFFTKAALLTFGGAYAVLPYVHQGAVEQFGWLTQTQMMSGLALGETTPGPLIMVVAFVGFVGGHGKALFGPDALFLAGAAAATLVTWFTFLPSFLFILAGGPLVESTRGKLGYTAPLTAITAAVVGVILDLVLFFARATLWPHGFSGSFDWLSALITLGAAIALLHYRRTTIEVIAGCALAGLLGQVLPV
ncbi:MAG TPA: chromate efflux transporter [Pseudomonadales bacterium]|nr:chromate efflux transporter [Pseudomonadales bacterium]